MTRLIPESPAGDAFSAYCEGTLDVDAIDPSMREEYASCAHYWLSIPAVAEPRDPEDSPLPNYLRDFIAALEA